MGRLQTKSGLTAASLLLMAAATLCAQQPQQRHHPPRHTERQQVEATEHAWQHAWSTADVGAMDHLLSDDFLGITGNGQVVTKAQQLDRMTAHRTEIRHMEFSDLNVKIKGSVAIVTSSVDLDATMDDHPVTGLFRSTRIYQREPNGTWQLTNFEATPIRPHRDHDHDDAPAATPAPVQQ